MPAYRCPDCGRMHDSDVESDDQFLLCPECSGHAVGNNVEVRFPDGWRAGYTVTGIVTALDHPYRINIAGPNGTVYRECDPGCVRLPR